MWRRRERLRPTSRRLARNAPQAQAAAFWAKVGSTYESLVAQKGDRPVWLSTEGPACRGSTCGWTRGPSTTTRRTTRRMCVRLRSRRARPFHVQCVTPAQSSSSSPAPAFLGAVSPAKVPRGLPWRLARVTAAEHGAPTDRRAMGWRQPGNVAAHSRGRRFACAGGVTRAAWPMPGATGGEARVRQKGPSRHLCPFPLKNPSRI